MASRWQFNYTLGQLMLVMVMVANVCGVIVVVRTEQRHEAHIVEGRFSPDGKDLVVLLDDGWLLRCDAASGRIVDSAPTNWPRDADPVFCQLAADCNTWAAVCGDGHVEFGHAWPPGRLQAAAPSAALQSTICEFARESRGLRGGYHTTAAPPALSDNAAVFAFAYYDPPPAGQFRVAIWDVASGRLLRTIVVPKPVFDISLSPDGKTLAIERAGRVAPEPCFNEIEFRDVASGARRGRALPVVWGGTMNWADDSDKLILVGGDEMRSARVTGGAEQDVERRVSLANKLTWTGGHLGPRRVTGRAERNVEGYGGLVLVSADGRTILARNGRDEVQFLDADTLGPLGPLLPAGGPHRWKYTMLLTISADGKQLAATDPDATALQVRISDPLGKCCRDVVLHGERRWIVLAGVIGNGLVFFLCLWLIMRQSWRRRTAQVASPSAAA